MHGKRVCKLCAQIALAEWNHMISKLNEEFGEKA